MFGRVVFEAIEVKGCSRLNFEAVTSKFFKRLWKFGCQPQKSKADLCMTNGSKILIFFVFFIVPQRLTLVSNAKRKISKSNKPELWNQRSALLFGGWQPNFQSYLKNIEVAASKFNIERPLPSMASQTALPNILKRSPKSMHLFQILIGVMNCR